MLSRTHLVFALFVFLIIFPYLNFVNRFVFLVFLLIASVFVDIDCKKSKIGKKWYFRPLQWFVKHRGVFHTLVFGLVIFLIIYLFSYSAGLGFLCGYVLHLFLDLFTKQGIMLFWPLSKVKVKLIRIKSGGLIEEIFFVLFLIFDFVLFLKILLNFPL
jgi:inner membrane protein